MGIPSSNSVSRWCSVCSDEQGLQRAGCTKCDKEIRLKAGRFALGVKR